MKVYKVPNEYIETLKAMRGTEGTLLNLDVQDTEGNTIIGQEEYNSAEFKYLKDNFKFDLIDYSPKPEKESALLDIIETF